MATVAEIREAIKARRARSAWDKGVKLYALDLLDNLKEDYQVSRFSVDVFLNGARNWKEYSEDGCSLVYDEDICARLCPPSMRKEKKNGELPPNSRETWMDVQARALRNAYLLIGIIVATKRNEEG